MAHRAHRTVAARALIVQGSLQGAAPARGPVGRSSDRLRVVPRGVGVREGGLGVLVDATALGVGGWGYGIRWALAAGEEDGVDDGLNHLERVGIVNSHSCQDRWLCW